MSKYLPNALEEFRQKELANMTDQERKEAMKQEQLEQLDAAREALAEAAHNLQRAQEREQELRKSVSVEYAELQELERATQAGNASSLQAARDLPRRTRQLQDDYDELGLLQNNTIPNLKASYDKAALEYELQESLTGKDGYLTPDEAQEVIDQAVQEIQSIIKRTATELRASDSQAQQMTASVERAQQQGVIDPLPHNAPIKVTGPVTGKRTLFINGQSISGDYEADFKRAVSQAYGQAV